MSHRIQVVAKIGLEDFEILESEHVLPSADNSSCAIVTCFPGTSQIRDVRRLWFNGEMLLDAQGFDFPSKISLSFDGSKLAYVVKRRVWIERQVSMGLMNEEDIKDGEDFKGNVVCINGKVAYESDLDTIHQFSWIDNNHLAWEGWYEDEDDPLKYEIEYFVNGKRVTGVFRFELFYGGIVVVVNATENEKGIATLIHADGTRDSQSEVNFDTRDLYTHVSNLESPVEYYEDGEVYVIFRGQKYPSFDAVYIEGGASRWGFSSDETGFAYIGIRYPRASKMVMRWVDKLIERENLIAGILFTHPRDNPIPLIGGLGHDIVERSKRYFPVNNGRVWEKGYRYADRHFYTPYDQLVVRAFDRRKQLVVIDEEEGPKFDEIWNVCYPKDENCVCYFARRGNKFYRVLVR